MLEQHIAGVVLERGSQVTDLAPGDEVFGFAPGAYAEYAAVLAGHLALKPQNVDFVAAAALPAAGLTAWQALTEHANLQAGQRLLIHGAAGGVGSLALQIAKWKKAIVSVTASAEDFDYLRGLGADQLIDYHSQHFEDLLRDMDVVFDLVGGKTLARSYQVLKKGGVLVTAVGPLNQEECKRLGLQYSHRVMRREAQGLTQLARLVKEGLLMPRVDRVLPLDQAAQAQDLNQTSQSHGKVVLSV